MRIIPNIKLTLSEVAYATGITTSNLDLPIGAIVTNSQEAKKNDLFVALRGESANGEAFTENAKKSGAFILSAKNNNADIKVTDTEAALLNVASFYKSKLNNLKHTVAITGSVGKTTAKNILSEVLKTFYNVHSTYGNYNNYLGVSHTILTAPRDCEILVVEMGMNHRGEISQLSQSVSPDVSVITNVGTAHIGNLGSRESIANAKLEIADGMKNPLIIMPEEEVLLKKAKGRYTFSISKNTGDCFLDNVKEDAFGAVLDVHTGTQFIKDLRINIPGRHVLSAVAIAASVLEKLGMELRLLADTLPKIKSETVVRAKMIKLGCYEIYDDTYSASYEATVANFEMLSKKEKKMSCILGDMLELGEESKDIHLRLGEEVVKYGFQNLFTFGKAATFIAKGALDAGMKNDCIFINEDIDSPNITAEQIKRNCERDELLFFKASHSIHAERIYSFLN